MKLQPPLEAHGFDPWALFCALHSEPHAAPIQSHTMWPILFAAAMLALTAAVAVAGYLWAARRSVQRESDSLRDTLAQREQAIEGYLGELETARSERDSIRTELHTAQQELARLKEREANFQQRVDELRKEQEQAHDKAREAFKALSNDALEKAEKRFLDMAKRSFEGEQKDAAAELERKKQAIESMLKPIRESLDKHAKAVTDIEKERQGSYHALKQQITSMQELQGQLRGETANLVKALRRPEVRGRWGEMQLHRVAELAGMIPHCDFQEQVSVRTDDATLRPDMVVRLPAGRTIVVDAKTPIEAYVEAAECEQDADREAALQRHLRHIDSKVQELAAKSYQSQFDRSPDFVVLFIPGESFLQAAVERSPDLMERAMNRGVVIATPSTLIALLKAVEMGWREQRIAESAEQVRDLGVELHERVGTFVGHFTTIGTHIEKTVGAYNKAVGSLETRVLVTARKFKDLGADSKKELPAEGSITPIETTPRQLTAESETP